MVLQLLKGRGMVSGLFEKNPSRPTSSTANNHMKPLNTLCGQNKELLVVTGGT
jgi:hypothetical protein